VDSGITMDSKDPLIWGGPVNLASLTHKPRVNVNKKIVWLRS
jgi:hypothetical protein